MDQWLCAQPWLLASSQIWENVIIPSYRLRYKCLLHQRTPNPQVRRNAPVYPYLKHSLTFLLLLCTLNLEQTHVQATTSRGSRKQSSTQSRTHASSSSLSLIIVATLRRVHWLLLLVVSLLLWRILLLVRSLLLVAAAILLLWWRWRTVVVLLRARIGVVVGCVCGSGVVGLRGLLRVGWRWAGWCFVFRHAGCGVDALDGEDQRSALLDTFVGLSGRSRGVSGAL